MTDRLGAVARDAAKGFLGTDVELVALGQGPTHTYRVEADAARYVLRVHAPERPAFEPGYYDRPGVESECMWLDALCRETELTVPEPIRAPDGSYALEVFVDSRNEPVPCTLLRWVEGELIEGRRTTEQAFKLAELLVALHEHTSGWTPPAGFVRPTLDRSWALEAVRRLEGLAAADVVPREHVDVLAAAVRMADEELTPFDDDPDRVGLIHADLHETNYVFHEGEARPIDFARASWAPWLVDLAETSMHLYPERRRDLVDAYARHRPLADADVRRIEGYQVAAAVEGYGYRAPDPAHHAEIAHSIAYFAERHVRRYLDGDPFVFEL